jgi:hypothetical protein
MPEYQQVNRHIECDARTYASLVPNQMRYQTALHPDVQQRLEILTGFPSRRLSPPALSRNGIAPNGTDGNRDFPEKFPWRSWAAMVSSRRMLAALICAAFGFLDNDALTQLLGAVFLVSLASGFTVDVLWGLTHICCVHFVFGHDFSLVSLCFTSAASDTPTFDRATLFHTNIFIFNLHLFIHRIKFFQILL